MQVVVGGVFALQVCLGYVCLDLHFFFSIFFLGIGWSWLNELLVV